jgi:hypothetical protein
MFARTTGADLDFGRIASQQCHRRTVGTGHGDGTADRLCEDLEVLLAAGPGLPPSLADRTFIQQLRLIWVASPRPEKLPEQLD